MTKATDAITAERERQITEEGYDAAHDRMHGHQLMAAAMCYLTVASHPHPSDLTRAPIGWPWAERYWKPGGGCTRNLVKAGALIAAALDSMTEGDEGWRVHSGVVADLGDREPLPSDGPDYHAEHAAWLSRQEPEGQES